MPAARSPSSTTRWRSNSPPSNPSAPTCESLPGSPDATGFEVRPEPPPHLCENGGMFTGIITGVGRIAAVHDLGSSSSYGKRLSIAVPDGYLDDVGLGDSIALNGACMTVTTLDPAQQCFTIDISAESLDKTAGLAEESARVNLEKALRANDRLGGHI